MSLVKLNVLTAAMMLILISAVGCTDYKSQVAELQVQNNDLQITNENLRKDLSAAQTRENQLLAQLDSKDMDLASYSARLAAAEDKASAIPATPAAGDWEQGLTADKVTVGTDILFSAGRASLTANGKSALNKIVGDLKRNYSGLPIRVYGHTDSDPIKKTKKLWQDNLDLSSNRAMAVSRHLISKGIKADLIETIGMGQEHPIASNSSASGKSKNRRVEIIVMK